MSSLILIIFVACLYSHYKYQEFSLKDYLSEPERFDGSVVNIDGKAGNVSSERFEFKAGENTITVMGHAEGLKKGDHFEMNAVFHKEDYLELQNIYVRKRRNLKIYVSILPVFLVAWLVLKEFKFDFKKRVLVER